MKEKKFLAGNDSDGGFAGIIMMIVGVICLVMIAAMAVCTIGVIIGAVVSLKNYFKALKENVIDDNRKVPAPAQ